MFNDKYMYDSSHLFAEDPCAVAEPCHGRERDECAFTITDFNSATGQYSYEVGCGRCRASRLDRGPSDLVVTGDFCDVITWNNNITCYNGASVREV